MKSEESIVKGVEIRQRKRLTKSERAILHVLIENYVNEGKGRVVHYNKIAKGVWGYERYDESLGGSLRTMVSRLNKKLKKEGVQIKNKNSFGYYLEEHKEEKKAKKSEVIEILKQEGEGEEQ